MQQSLLLHNLQLPITTLSPCLPRCLCKSSLLKTLYLIILALVPLLAWPIFPLRCSLVSFFNKLGFPMDKTSDSSLCLYQELRPTRKCPLWLSLSNNNKWILLCKDTQLDRTSIKGILRVLQSHNQMIEENHPVWWHRTPMNAGGMCITNRRAVDQSLYHGQWPFLIFCGF